MGTQYSTAVRCLCSSALFPWHRYFHLLVNAEAGSFFSIAFITLNLALKREAGKRDFRDARMPMYFGKPQVHVERAWKRETVIVRNRTQVRYRDTKTGRFIRKV